ncbi:MAG: pentapeptide repeat-containing protein [Desmonostoc vinosum HA7617-LM4]|jgi:uncharacterized protein YjbI with pentapeptide repeats|nr:pentapeptide repeat-containing protein [Desmonostoc vinosum HA7617-LM4]
MTNDFSKQNLRGHSFKRQDLTGADFSYADIRGVDFTGANLKEAKFIGAKTGLRYQWTMGLVLISRLISRISKAFSAYIDYLSSFNFYNSTANNFYAGVVCLVLLTIFWVFTVNKGIVVGFAAFVIAVVGAFVFAKALAKVGIQAGARAITGAVAFAFAFATVGILALFFINAGFLAFAAALLIFYIGWRALKGDERQAWTRSFEIIFAATRGTSFRDADLTDADFTRATLKNTDFSNSILTRTCFHQAIILSFVCPGATYLGHTQIRNLLVTGQGQGQNFDYQDLWGINLKGANLTDASFVGADLSKANLHKANLSRAKLVKTQLNGTDLTDATVTGAYIEDWGITKDTKFDGVKCEYIYTCLPTSENPHPFRKPYNSQKTFVDGEFCDLIEQIFDTLDLYHQGNNIHAIATSHQQNVRNQIQRQPSVNTEAFLTQDDIGKLLAELETLIQGAELPADIQEEVIEDLRATKKAIDKKEPNIIRALDRLTNVAEIIETAANTVDVNQKLWYTAMPIIAKVTNFLSAAVNP